MSISRNDSAFATFLKLPDVQSQLAENINQFFTEDKITLSYISRYFNELPLYPGMQIMLDCLKDALTDKEQFKAWIDLAMSYAIDDLFDDHGDLLPQVAEVLNYKKTPESESLFDMVYRLFNISKEELHAYILASYLQMYNTYGSNIVGTLPNIDSLDLNKNPLSIYSKFSIATSNLQNIDEDFLYILDSKLAVNASSAECKLMPLKKYYGDKAHKEIEGILNRVETKTKLHENIKIVIDIVKQTSTDAIAIENLNLILTKMKDLLTQEKIDKNLILSCVFIANKIDKLSSSEIIRGVGVGLGGTAIVTVTAMIALSSFGAISLPLLAFSEAVGSMSTVASATTLGGTVYNDYGFFKRLFSKSPLAIALENVANEATACMKAEEVAKKVN